MPVLTIRYGVILIYDEIVECAGKNSMEAKAELSDKFLTGWTGFYIFTSLQMRLRRHHPALRRKKRSRLPILAI